MGGTPSAGERAATSWRRRAALVVAGLLLVSATAAALSYHRQIWSYATHWKGGPSTTWQYEALPPGTAPLLRLAVAGDVGDSGRSQARVAAAMAQVSRTAPFDVLLLLGDNVYPAGDPGRLEDLVFGPFAPVLDTGAELRAVLGNHDVKKGHGDDQMAALGMPGRWWARDDGRVLLVGLDSTRVRDAAQLAWLEQTLSTTRARWRIVALHHPPYSAGYQGSNRTVREVLAPLLREHGVQLVLSGHDHDYQRSVPLDGVTYVVSGAGAGSRRTGTRDFTAVAYATPHFLDLTVEPDRLVVQAVDRDGRVFDRAVLLPGTAVR